MQITELNVGNYGVWQDFRLSLNAGSINVIYGPNEAGKSTLMRFVGEMMYGFGTSAKPSPNLGSGAGPAGNGSLKAAVDGVTYELTRAADLLTPAGRVTVSGELAEDNAEQRLVKLLDRVDPVVFHHVFCIGLNQLQQLATLNDTDAARFLFDLTLGTEGQQLLQASLQADRALRELWSSDTGAGRLGDLVRQRQDCRERLQNYAHQNSRYAQIKQDLSTAEYRISDIKSRQSGLNSQLHGHQFLEAAWRPWNRIKEFEDELNLLDACSAFPPSGLERLEQIETESQEAEACRDAAREQAASLQDLLDNRSDRRLAEQYAAMQDWVQDQRWVQQIQASVDEARQRAAALEQTLQTQLAELNAGWSVERWQQVDLQSGNAQRLLAAQRDYRVAVARCRRLRKRCRRLDQHHQRQQAGLEQELSDLGYVSVEQGLDCNTRLLDDVQDVLRMKLRCHELRQSRDAIGERLRMLHESAQLPTWLSRVMQGFMAVGVALVVWGLVSGLWISGLAGCAYVCLGVTWLGMHRGLKQHLSGETSTTIVSLQQNASHLGQQIWNAEAALAELVRQTQLGGSATRPGHVPRVDWTTEREQDCLRNVALQRLQLESLAQRQTRLTQSQNRLARAYDRLKLSLGEAGEAHKSRGALLREIGLPEDRPEQGLEIWQRLFEMDAQRRELQSCQQNLEQQTRTLDWIQQRLSKVCRAVGRWQDMCDRPVGLLEIWQGELAQLEASRHESQRLIAQHQAAVDEVAEYQTLLDECQVQRDELLQQAGVTTREAFERQALDHLRCEELNSLIQAARNELTAVAESDSALAIVEEDLEGFDLQRNTEHIEMLELELASLDEDLSSAYEDMGGHKAELQRIESDNSASLAAFELAQTSTSLRETATEWCQLRLAAELVERLKAKYERQTQPETLRVASKFLQQLTRGRYQSVWAPLGSRRLCVRDDRESVFEVDQLSGGTREQLYLAVRLALVEQFAQQGITLPMVLDDVLVNFDHGRTELAVETLLEFSQRRQQQLLVFTCHLHLAHLFESKGVEPIWLPGHQLPQTSRRAG